MSAVSMRMRWEIPAAHEEIYGSCRGRTAVPGRLYLGLYRPVNLQKDRYGKEFQAYGGDFDDHPCDYNFSGNGIVYGGERDASPKMQEVKFCYQNIAVDVQKDKAVVKNKNLFVNTDAFDCVVILEKKERN